MAKNVGGVDRGIRLVLGVVLIALALTHVVAGTLAIAAYVIGGIALVTGALQVCPAWGILGINTCATAKK